MIPIAAKVIGVGALGGFGLYKLFSSSKTPEVQSLKTHDPHTGRSAQVVVPVTSEAPVLSQSVVPPASTDQVWNTQVVTTDPNWDWQLKHRGFDHDRWDRRRGFIPPPITPGLLPLAPTIITPNGAAPLAIQTTWDIQHALNALGHGPLRVDGRIGPRTLAALHSFQGRAGLPQRGMSAETPVHLQNALRASIPRVTAGGGAMRSGHHGIAIGAEPVVTTAGPQTPIALAKATGTPPVSSPAAVQAALNAVGISPPLKVDGEMGAKTVASVKAFQIVHGLVADGVPGPQTRTALAVACAPPEKLEIVKHIFAPMWIPETAGDEFREWIVNAHLHSYDLDECAPAHVPIARWMSNTSGSADFGWTPADSDVGEEYGRSFERERGERERQRDEQETLARLLQPENRSETVAKVQRALNNLGVSPPLVTDGRLGQRTLTAIQRFQQHHGLVADGRLGRNLFAALDNASDFGSSATRRLRSAPARPATGRNPPRISLVKTGPHGRGAEQIRHFG